MHGRKKWEYYHRPASVARQMKFFDHFLKDIDNEVPDWPRVLLEIRERGYVGRWIERAAVAARSYRVPAAVPRRATDCSASRSRAREGELRYDATEPGARAQFDYTFDEATDLVGYMKLRLWVEAVGSDDIDLFVAVQRFDPEGRVRAIFRSTLSTMTATSPSGGCAPHIGSSTRRARHHRNPGTFMPRS